MEKTLKLERTWANVCSLIKDQIGTTAFKAWFEPLRPKQKDERSIILAAPDGFFKDWIIQHYLDIIRDALKKACGYVVEVEMVVDSLLVDKVEKTRFAEFRSRIEEPADALRLNPRYTFENFVVGPSNRFAHAASLAVVDSPAKTYNPLFIYGGVGLGKTHLMQAICHSIQKNNPNSYRIHYTPSEKFTNELIEAIRHQSTARFREKYRNVDVLVVDDIHFIAGKEATQEEFFHTFNTLYDSHKQIIISSDRSPRDISKLEERLVSRFAWGLITDIQPPDLETRIAILKKKVEKEPVQVPDDVIYFIAERIKTNIRELEGAIIKVIAYSLLEEKPISLDLTTDVLKDLLVEDNKLITVDYILKTVADNFSLTPGEIKGKKRNKNIIFPRQVAMYLSRELTNLSLPEIGEYFGGKDHTTVLYTYNKIKQDLLKDRNLKSCVEGIIKKIKY